jgi:hypothetical protein
VLAASVLVTIQYIKRLHDINLSGWYWLLGFMPLINIAFGLYATLKDGTPGPNRFGEDPKGWKPAQIESENSEEPFQETKTIQTTNTKKMKSSYGVVAKVIGITWAIGFLFMALYVPYGDYIINQGDILKHQEIITFGWIFFGDFEGRYASSMALINFELLIFQLLAWSVICWGLIFLFKNEKRLGGESHV